MTELLKNDEISANIKFGNLIKKKLFKEFGCFLVRFHATQCVLSINEVQNSIKAKILIRG